jgi:hypothetical protein
VPHETDVREAGPAAGRAGSGNCGQPGCCGQLPAQEAAAVVFVVLEEEDAELVSDLDSDFDSLLVSVFAGGDVVLDLLESRESVR